MRVLFGNVLIKPLTIEQTKNGLFLPETNQNDPVQQGKVIARGAGSLALDGSPIPLEVSDGDTVLYKTHSAQKIRYEGSDHVIVEQRDILMVV